MTIKEIPATIDEYTLIVDIPGHFQYSKKITLRRTIDGKVQGIFYVAYTDTAAAGETGDKLKADLNKDGIVDIVDLEGAILIKGILVP